MPLKRIERGDTDDDACGTPVRSYVCPRCGVSLFRPACRKSRPDPPGLGAAEALPWTFGLAARPGRAAHPSPSGSDAEIHALSEPHDAHPGTGSLAAVIAPVAAIVALALAWAVAVSPPGPPGEKPGLHADRGTLAYAADLGSGWQRLWLLDLASARLSQGPRIPATRDLLGSFGGWIALASERPGGMKVAYVLRGRDPGALPERVARGDHLSWDPTGYTVVAARRSSRPGQCLRAVAVTVAGDPPWSSNGVLSHRILCSDLLSIVRGEALTFYTR